MKRNQRSRKETLTIDLCGLGGAGVLVHVLKQMLLIAFVRICCGNILDLGFTEFSSTANPQYDILTMAEVVSSVGNHRLPAAGKF